MNARLHIFKDDGNVDATFFLIFITGGSDDWAKGAAKIKYAYTIELRDTGRHGFLLPASHIKSSGKEAFAAIKAIAKEMNS